MQHICRFLILRIFVKNDFHCTYWWWIQYLFGFYLIFILFQSSSSSSYQATGDHPQKSEREKPPHIQPLIPPLVPVNDYDSNIHHSPPRSPNGAMSSSHGHGHSYSHGHSYNYGQSQGYNQSYGHSRPYNRVSHSHHRRRYDCSPEGNATYSTADASYQHNIRESERDRDFKCRDKYTGNTGFDLKL